MALATTPLTRHFGVRVDGVDLRAANGSPALAAELSSLLYRHGLLCIPNQHHLSPHDDDAVARWFSHDPDEDTVRAPTHPRKLVAVRATHARLPTHKIRSSCVHGRLHVIKRTGGAPSVWFTPSARSCLAMHAVP